MLSSYHFIKPINLTNGKTMNTEKLKTIVTRSILAKIILSGLVVGLSACAAGGAYSQQQPGLLTDKNEMTLYVFDKDSEGQSNCYQQCATNWPPYLAQPSDAKSKGFSKISRKDGSQQWAYKGSPLYYWKMDQQSGDATGEGIGGVWHTVKLKSGASQKSVSGGYSNSDY